MSKLKHQKPGIAAQLYRPLGEAEVKKLADAALDVLEAGGVAVYSPTAREAMVAAGAKADGDGPTLRLPRSLVEDAVASNPSSITLHARGNDDYNAELTDSKVHYGTGGTALYVLDPDTGERREATTGDVALNARFVEHLDNIHVFTINVYPHNVKNKDDIDPNRFFHALDNTTKHVMGGIYSPDGCQKAVRLAETVAGGAEKLRAEPFVSFITLVISPFKIDKDYGEMACYLARENLPVVVPTEPICGTTSPITLAGNVLTHTAETLAGIAMIQCVNRGAPGICGSVGSITHLATMDHLGGPIERAMINAAVAQMAQHFEIPLYSTGGTTDAKSVDIQAAYESAMSSLLVAMSGANYIHDIAGLMEADLTVSYEKLVMDDEILGMCQRVLRGIEVDDETLGVEMLVEKGPGGDYLTEDHTIRHMREEFFVPRLANRDKRAQMQPADEALDRAKRFVRELREAEAESCLPPDVRKQALEQFPEIITE